MLEPCAGKLARTVLRGRCGGNAASLLGENDPLGLTDPVGLDGLSDAGNFIIGFGKGLVNNIVGRMPADLTTWIGPHGENPPDVTFGPPFTIGNSAAEKSGAAWGNGVGIALQVGEAFVPGLGEEEVAALVVEEAEVGADVGRSVRSAGRSGKQARLKELGQDPKVGRDLRGWIQQEENAIARGTRRTRRVPPGHVLAHRRGFPAKGGFGYGHSDLQEIDLHKLQHKIEGY